ncbi:MAG: serine/threonine protein kinase [Deltaproteobacteria bacterium]|nr:serine/threonine protein kinase [Deltaproteobacteria bacterium]
MVQPFGQDDPPREEEREQATLPVGTVLGSYRIERILGIGGMGTVYLAIHQRLGRKVALKTLHPEFATNPTAVRRLFAEARAVNQIQHENIVEITDFVETGQLKYYIMELLDGRDLAEIQLEETHLSIARAIRIGVQIADTLEAVHAGGIVHRDLKPANVFLIERSGRPDFVKLLDFGVAKLMDQPKGDAMSRTAAGAIVGTPDYMSPEQAAGKPVDHRTDIYSLGVILYEMVGGQKPFKANSLGELVVKHLTITPTRPSKLKDLPHEIPAELERIILSCLEKDASRRPQSIGAVAAQLRELGMGMTDWALLTGEHTALAPGRPRRSPLPAIAGVVGLAAVAGLTAVFWPREEPGPVNPPPIVFEAPVKTEVTLSIDSVPTGAMVFLAGQTEPIGLTPLSEVFPLSEEQQQFELRLEGYETETFTLPLDADARVSRALKEIPVVEEPPKPVPRKKSPKVVKKQGPTHKRGVIDPFAN